MQNDFLHLKDFAIKHLALSDEERINRIRSPRWIGYPRSAKILSKLEELLTIPQSHRMPNLLIVGDTNNGKTMLVRKFCDKYPPNDNIEGEAAIVPVLYIHAPPTPDESRFYNTILEEINAPFKPSSKLSQKEFQAIKLLKTVGLKVLIIDEIQQILAGSLNRQRAFLNVIKTLGNKLKVPIVGVGTAEAYRALQTDAQLSNRFEPAPLPQWKLDATYQALLASFETMIPLRSPSRLTEPSLAKQIYTMSEGYIGEISRILTNAAILAVKSGREQIDTQLLSDLDWCAPSDRRYRPEQL